MIIDYQQTFPGEVITFPEVVINEQPVVVKGDSFYIGGTVAGDAMSITGTANQNPKEGS